MKSQSEILNGCGKEFDIYHYGYVKCGERYNNIMELGDDQIVHCPSCQSLLDYNQEIIKMIDNNLESYPEDIFPKLSEKQLKLLSECFNTNFGFPLDRLSAHILRRELEELKQNLQGASNE